MLTTEQSSQLAWQKVDNLMPVIVQHAVSGDVLMLGYMNPEALQVTLDSRKVTFFSRTKQRLWTKARKTRRCSAAAIRSLRLNNSSKTTI